MRKKRSAAALKAQVEQKKPKVEVKHETSEEEESDHEAETQEVEESESEEVKDDNEEVEEEEDEEEEEVEEEEEEEEEVEEEEEEEEEVEEEGEEEDHDDDESSKKETLRKLLEPLPKDKIIEFLKEAALNDRSIVARLIETAEADPAHRKIFVFGLGWDATSDQVLSVFQQYGDIEECKVVTDKITGRAKGYGFVLFKTRRSAQKALKQPQKKIGTRMASCQLASTGGPGGPGGPAATSDPTARKIFVANVGSHVNPNTLKSFFSKFGEIEEGPLGIDTATGKFKGFAMFIYKSAEGCKRALEEPTKVFDGCQLQCRQAVEKNKNFPMGGSGNLPQSDLGNLAFGYGGFYGPAGGLMVGQNPMLVSALNQGSVSPTPQSFGLSADYGSQLGLAGRSSGSITAAARQQSGLGSLAGNFSSYLGR